MNGFFKPGDLLCVQSQDVQFSNRKRVTVEPLSKQIHAPQRTWKSEIRALRPQLGNQRNSPSGEQLAKATQGLGIKIFISHTQQRPSS